MLFLRDAEWLGKAIDRISLEASDVYQEDFGWVVDLCRKQRLSL